MLARKGRAVVAFAITKCAHGNPDIAEFDYMSRADGGTVLDPSHPAVRHGHGVTTDSCVVVDDLAVEWSYRSRTTGWVYFEHVAQEIPAADSLELCVTHLGFIDLPIDTGSPSFKWRMKP